MCSIHPKSPQYCFMGCARPMLELLDATVGCFHAQCLEEHYDLFRSFVCICKGNCQSKIHLCVECVKQDPKMLQDKLVEIQGPEFYSVTMIRCLDCDDMPRCFRHRNKSMRCDDCELKLAHI